MILFWRFFRVIFFSRFSSKLNLFEQATSHFRVLPSDVDILMHMNNGRYFSFLDLARIDFMIRNQIFPKLRKRKIYGVVASELIRFKKSIDLFQSFQIKTQLLGWDENFFYVCHHFTIYEQLCAVALVKICFINRAKGRLKTKEIIPFLEEHESKELPTWINDWRELDLDFYKYAKLKNDQSDSSDLSS